MGVVCSVFKKSLILVLAGIFTLSASITLANPVRINPQSLRERVLDRNVGLLIQMNRVQQAKTKVNVARGNLLPSVNLGALISSDASFLLSTVNMVVPFLLPSNWFDLRESQFMLNAQSSGYYIAQLNTYSSAYSTYMGVLGDQELREVLYRQYNNYRQIEELIAQAVEAGLMFPTELLQAQAQTQLAMIQVSQVDSLLKTAKASMREMLALPLDVEIVFEPHQVPVSYKENESASTLLRQALSSAPEIRQMDYMITAAKASKWSQAFSFITGASLSQSRGVDGSFGSTIRTGSVNLGFGYFPSLKLTDLNVQELQLQKRELELAQAELIESALGQLQEAKIQLELAQQATASLERVYENEVLKFKNGLTDLLHVLDTANRLTIALTNKVKAQTNVNVLRISLQRILLTEDFGRLRACSIQRSTDKKAKPVSLDQACLGR